MNQDRKRHWSVQLTGHVQTTRLVGQHAMRSYFNCKIDVTEDLFVRIPAAIIMRAAALVGIDWNGGLNQEQVNQIQDFFVGHPVRFRYWLESWQEGEYRLQQYGGEVLEIL